MGKRIVAIRAQADGKQDVHDVALGDTVAEALDSLERQTNLACVEIWQEDAGICTYVGDAQEALADEIE